MKISNQNRLSKLKPVLVTEWNYTRNNKLTPEDATVYSNKKVWWKCKKCGYEWQAIISDRSKGSGCASCSNQIVTSKNCLATLYPEIAKLWHPTKNGKLTPNDVVSGSSRHVWWKCKNGHELYSAINDRIYGHNFGCCTNRIVHKDNCLSAVFPKIAKEWNYKKNSPLTPDKIVFGSAKKVWWKCKNNHEWEQTVDNRVRNGRNCPYCCNQKIDGKNCLAILNPRVAKEWNYEKNSKLTPYNVSCGTRKKVWWKCKKGHEWEDYINNRAGKVNHYGCPYCNNRRVCEDNCLATVKPHLTTQWHPIKNKKNTPYNVFPYSNKKAWWKCKKCGNVYYRKISFKSHGGGCPNCSKVVLKDGTKWDSVVEAYFYLKYKKEKLKFTYHGLYGKKMGKRKYDFYFSKTNTYVEITSFDKRVIKYLKNKKSKIYKMIKEYYKNINKKRRYVKKELRANFQLICFVPKEEQINIVRQNTEIAK